MCSDPTLFSGPDAPIDTELDSVERRFTSKNNMTDLFGEVFRQSFDEVLDGQRTGRFDIERLDKTEKTYLGTKVEIVGRTVFDLHRGKSMDYSVDGVEVDSKFTLTAGSWMIPQEAMGHLCLLLTADDRSSNFSVGLVRISESILTKRGNQDKKRSISARGREMVRWVVSNGEMPVNTLLGMGGAKRDRIMSDSKSGQNRVDQLFREVQQEMVNRETVVTVGKQLDAPKRVRDARKRLREEGIIILGHQKRHVIIARDLNQPLSPKGSWLALRIIPHPLSDDRPAANIDGREYVVAREDDPVQPAPVIDW